MKGKFLVGFVFALVVGALTAAPSFAHVPQFYNEEAVATRVLLRSVATAPPKTALQPDAMEFVNSGHVEVGLRSGPTKTKGEEKKLVVCTEVEFGTTVVSNTEAGEEKTLENKLAMPFGVAEGNSCNKEEPPTIAIPTYFDTTAAGAVPATITFKGGPGPPIFATIHKLKLSMVIEGKFCTVPFEGTTGEVVNLKGFPGEEGAPNLELVFTAAAGSTFATCEGSTTKYTVSLTAHYLLETMSTLTDTVWIE